MSWHSIGLQLTIVASVSLACTGKSPVSDSQSKSVEAPATEEVEKNQLPTLRAKDSAAANLQTKGIQSPEPATRHALEPSALVDIKTLLPNIKLDIRYASTNNFSGERIYAGHSCHLRGVVAEALARVQSRLKTLDYQLLIWDCYRPFHIQEKFWAIYPDPKYVARPKRDSNGRPSKGSKHNRGAAIDCALLDRSGNLVALPTDHDDFSSRAHRDSQSMSKDERRNLKVLTLAMKAEGFGTIASEWWHFDFRNWSSFPLSEEPI